MYVFVLYRLNSEIRNNSVPLLLLYNNDLLITLSFFMKVMVTPGLGKSLLKSNSSSLLI